MDNSHTLHGVRAILLGKESLEKAIRQTHVFLSNHLFVADDGVLESIENDYRLMKDFMAKGYVDPDQERLYAKLKQRLYQLSWDLERKVAIRLDPAFGQANSIASRFDLQPEAVKASLEAHVQEMAVLSLDGQSDESARQRTALQKNHQQYLDNLFNALLIAPHWNVEKASAFESVLLSPTIEPNDALLAVSGITLSVMNFADENKLSLLVNIYRKATDEHLRQRAFIGWVTALSTNDLELYPEVKALVDENIEGESGRELIELQMQMVYCINTDADNAAIQRDILPDMINNSRIRITRHGIQELDEDSLQNILNPEASEEAMEKMENSMRRMMDMQRQGVDIYFGGFSQMKRFPFFSKLSNWFMPFYTQHPQLSDSNPKMSQLADSRFMSILLENGPFCDSDKYSFAFALSQIIGNMPENMREMLHNDDMFGETAPAEERGSAAYIRRMYLQDLYRFFMLNPLRRSFENPFEETLSTYGRKYIFVANPVFSKLAPNLLLELANFLFKKKRYDEALDVLNSHQMPDDAEYQTLYGWLMLKLHNIEEAADYFNTALEIDDLDERALRGLGVASYALGDYREAADCYDALHKMHPDKPQFLVSYYAATIEFDCSEEVMNELFRMFYEDEDDVTVQRLIAWAYLKQGRAEKASPFYDKLMAQQSASNNKKSSYADDLFNAAYCKWALRQMDDAVAMMKKYKTLFVDKDAAANFKLRFQEDGKLLDDLGIGPTERLIMIDIVCEGDS